MVKLYNNYYAYFEPQLQQEEELAAFRNLLGSNFDILCDNGYRRPTGTATPQEDKNEIVRTVSLNQTIYRSLAELDQLKAGLNVLDVTDEIAKNRQICWLIFSPQLTLRG